MNALRLSPVIISFVLLAAHFYRAGQLALVMVMFVLLLLLLVIKQAWLPRLIQVVLLLGALEWLRTLLSLVHMRMEFGLPWIRLAVILGTVALFTALSGLVFRHKALKKRYERTPRKSAQ